MLKLHVDSFFVRLYLENLTFSSQRSFEHLDVVEDMNRSYMYITILKS